ncbi:ATP-binding protein [Desulfonema ishimotonii]|uniref:ATP-binding protein n=1 Tax=Desulfonema ishimotonii TaxID=45657 RepID=A0A401FWD1_9BACT|nr:ATP-binding protein [Desulfonema ishimotonii]GBC61276.1 ATP-binding protein [Desulfonema ishimotonii]
MLLEFSVKNFLSIKDKVIFSLYASDEVKGHEKYNLIPVADQHILKSAVIYGANASGKSNFIKAMGFMRRVIVNSLKLNPEEPIVSAHDYPSFQLNPKSAKAPLEMEASFLYQDIYYRYGFVLDADKIHREWLYFAPEEEENESLLYERRLEKGEYAYDIPDESLIDSDFTKNKKLPDNTLLLAVLAKFTDSPARRVMEWIGNTFNVITSPDENAYEGFTYRKLDEDDYHANILKFLKVADVGIQDVFLKSVTTTDFLDNMPEELRKGLKQLISDKQAKQIVFQHSIFDDKGEEIDKKYWGQNNESAGTKKLFALSGPLIETLKKGEILVIDELDAKLHPMMMRFIIGLFHSKKHNPYNAQLVFATHDTQLLSPRFFRRDQIWFTEKNHYEATDLYSLADFDLDNDADFSRDYFQGRYNAVPFIGDLSLFDKGVEYGEE